MFPENLPEVRSSFIGVIFAVVGNILISVALNVQKYAHNELEQSKHSKYTPYSSINGCQSARSHRPTSVNPDNDDAYLYLHSKAWWLGILLMIIGEFGNFIAYAFAPASVVAPLGTVALISNVILAPIMLNETFRKQDLLGVTFAIIGAIIVVASSRPSEVKLDPDAIWKALGQTTFLIYFTVTVVAMACLMVVSDKIGPQCILVDMTLVALFGGYTVLTTKGLSSLLTSEFVSIFQYSITYILGFVLVVTAVLQIKYLNKALQRFDSTQVIPTQFVLFTISAIGGSAVLYNDFADAPPEKCSSFFLGCLMTFLGIYLITSNRKVTRGRRPQSSRIGFPFSEEYDVLVDNAPYIRQTATATSIPRRHSHSLYTRGTHSSAPHLHEQYEQHDSLLRSMIHGGASLTAGVGQALNSVGTRHSHALGLGLVFENYLQKMEDEHNEQNGNYDVHHRRSQSVPPVFASRRFGFPSYQNGRAQHIRSSPDGNRVNSPQQYYRDETNSIVESNEHPQSPTTDSYLSRSYTNSSYYDDASGYTESVHTDDDEVTVSNLTTSSADSSRRVGLYSSDAGSTYDAFPDMDEFQQPGDLPDLPYRRERNAVGGYSDSDGDM